MKILKHIAILVIAVQICTIPLAAAAAKRTSDAAVLFTFQSSGADLLGMTQEQLDKRFPPPQFKHNSDNSQISWHGTDMSTVLDLRYKDNKVSQIRYTTHYGYPRPGTASNVSIGPWINQSQAKKGAETSPASKIEAFKKELKQH